MWPSKPQNTAKKLEPGSNNMSQSNLNNLKKEKCKAISSINANFKKQSNGIQKIKAIFKTVPP